MITVNLSRLHSIIKKNQATAREKQQSLQSMGYSSIFRIFEGTTDDDMHKAQARLARGRENVMEMVNEIQKIFDYEKYLVVIRDKKNIESGLAEKLATVAALGKRVHFLKFWIKLVEDSMSPGAVLEDTLKPADFYKTAFTDNQKFYDIDLSMFTEDELRETKKKLRLDMRAMDKINDEIAAMNQSVAVEILEFEEFSAQA